jgi:hypothetical protein
MRSTVRVCGGRSPLSLGVTAIMSAITPVQRQNLNRLRRLMGTVGIGYLLACVLLFVQAGYRFSFVDLHPEFQFAVILLGLCIFWIPLWWMSNHLHKRFGLVCGECGRWLSFRRAGEVYCSRCSKGEAVKE